MDGGKYFSHIQSVSSTPMYGSCTLESPMLARLVLKRLGYDAPVLNIVDTHGNRMKRKHNLDKARKVPEKHMC